MALESYRYTLVPGTPGGPLLVALHGTGGTDASFASFGRELSADATILAPRGDVSEGGALRFFRRTAEGVYDMEDLERASAKMAAFIAVHADAEQAPSVLGVGYSNGANILASVVFRRPDLFDAVVLMHPLIPFEPEIRGDLNGLRILITAGTRDPICPPHLTSRLESYLRAAGADVAVEWHPGGHEVRAEELAAARAFLDGAAREREHG